MAGWVKLDRSIQDHWLWSEKPFSKAQAWVDLILSANHKGAKFMIKHSLVEIERGQQARSEVTLSKEWGWSRDKVRRFLKLLENDGMIRQQKTNITTVLTICNYERFQSSEAPDDTADDTADKTAVDTPTRQQSIHKQECKNEKNEKNEKKKDLKDLSSKRDDVNEIFEYWKLIMGKSNQSKLTRERAKKIKDRLSEGYTVQQIKSAVLGCSLTPHNMGSNTNGKVYDDIELICRTGGNLERFANNSVSHAKPAREFSEAAEKTINNIMNVELN